MNEIMKYINANTIVTFGILFYVIYKYIMAVKTIKKDNVEDTFLSEHFVTIGILGTFVGITLGLLKFKVDDITGSIPNLLEGMRTAFFTSIIGMLGSLLYKNQAKKYVSETASVDSGATLDTVAMLLREQLSSIKGLDSNFGKELEKNIGAIKNSLVGEGDSTLITQLKNIRIEQKDFQSFLSNEFKSINNSLDSLATDFINEFREFAKNMAENNNKAFIEALNESMKDLNSQLTEQFGENFKELNAAVKDLVTWQENYKETVTKTTENQKSIFEGIDSIKTDFKELVTESYKMTEVGKNLEIIMGHLELQQKEFKQLLEGYANMSKEAYTLIPNFEKSNMELTKGFKLIDDNTRNIVSSVERIFEKTSSDMEKTSDILMKNMEKHIEIIGKASLNLENESLTITKRVSDNINQMVEDNNSNLKASVENINKSLESSLNNSLNSLGTHLGSLSNKFVTDYTPLTENLKRIVEISKGV